MRRKNAALRNAGCLGRVVVGWYENQKPFDFR